MSRGTLRRRAPGILLALGVAWSLAGCSTSAVLTPACSRPGDDVMVLQAQAVPTATRLPCLTDLPVGWTFAGSRSGDGETTLWLDHDRAGTHAVEVSLRATCDPGDAVEVPAPPGDAGMRAFQGPTSLEPRFAGSRFEVFEGGCIEYRYAFDEGASAALAIEADQAIATVPRSDAVAAVRERFDLTLCGADAPPCER